MRQSLSLLFALALSLALLPAWGEARIVAGEVPPFVYMEKGAVKGVAADLVREMAKRVGHSGKIDVQPFTRMLETGKTEANVLLIPLGRNAAREASYQWVTGLVDEEFVLIGHATSKVDVSSFNPALTVGVMRDSVGAGIAKSKGFTKIEDVVKEDMNAQKLANGRIDAWLAAWNSALQGQRAAGLDAKQLKRGAVASRVSIYLGASLKFDKAEAETWKAALEAMKKDGSFDRIVKSYGYELPK
ncbi:substrate-binding periplasmic protein [Chitinimonas sp. JJ19]|uniref:substrate-binding periplasmic protein n=1 Tax=Chitinimonas sp. JJ19 TaxID=3109352 RepID=UPI003002ED01